MTGNSPKSERFLQHLEPLQWALEAYCRRSLDDAGAVDDVLQNAVSKAFRDFDRYREGTNFRAWIFRYLNLEILSWNRRESRTEHHLFLQDAQVDRDWVRQFDESLFDELPSCPEKLLEQCEGPLASALLQLGDVERSTFLLRAIGEFRYREIAEILDMPVGTVMSHLSRARACLRRRLSQFAPQNRSEDGPTESPTEPAGRQAGEDEKTS